MLYLSRVGLFLTVFFTYFFISESVRKTHKHSDVVFLENFDGFSFLFLTIVLLVWTYFVHKQDKKDAKQNLKEVLYCLTFLSGFMSFASFIGWC